MAVLLGPRGQRHPAAGEVRSDAACRRGRAAADVPPHHPQSVRHITNGATMTRQWRIPWLGAQGSGLGASAHSPQPPARSEFKRGQMLVITLWMLGIVSLAVGAVVMRSGHEAR